MFPRIYTETLSSGFSFDMLLVKAGSVLMGSNDSEIGYQEMPVHRVRVPSFYLGQFPVTQALWKAVMGENDNPSNLIGDAMPVESVNWLDTQVFIQKLN